MNTADLQRSTVRGPRSRDRVRTLLAAAREVFSELGYQRATTALIAERAGVSEATVFTYFPGKQALCIQVIQDWYDDIAGRLETELPRLPDWPSQLAWVVKEHLHTLLADGSGLCALVLGEGRTMPPELADPIRQCQKRYTAPFMQCLAQARARGEVRSDMPQSLLRDLVYGTMEHVLWESFTRQRRPALDVTARQLGELFHAAMQPPAPDAVRVAALQRLQRELSRALQGFERSTTA